ncbi:MAG: 4-hydroxy-3-methylbut-2-enyl diphosphate reductase [Bacteroidales bacterium]|nr:4-hydroxy-3-methylbut-2-enyl diphosphate reductase [Bacteroidales bacterium]
MKVETDASSGFCGGVIRAVSKAEEYLVSHEHLYSLGAIVHNEKELERLRSRGLRTIEALDDVPEGETILVRAHGEPPQTYLRAQVRGLNLIDCTCPVVLQLQKRIREAYLRLKGHGKVIIFGRVGHAEVLGLVGQADGDALVVEDLPMLEEAIESGALDLSLPMEIFSQTTKSPTGYKAICDYLISRGAKLTVHDTICAQVSGRHSHLEEFARNHDIIIFVAGESSSNGKVLFDLCRGVNPRAVRIGGASELRKEWFRDGDRVGVCGATSTPKWLLEEVAKGISAFNEGK